MSTKIEKQLSSQNQMLMDIKHDIKTITQLLSPAPAPAPQKLSKHDNLKVALRKSNLLEQLKKINLNNK